MFYHVFLHLPVFTILWPVLMSPRKGLTRGLRVSCFEYYVLLNHLYQIAFNKFTVTRYSWS